MDFLGKKIHRKLGAWPCDGELAWCAYGPGSIGSKAGKKGEMEKGTRGKEKIGRTGEKR